jgi:pilus assembly protein CpaF
MKYLRDQTTRMDIQLEDTLTHDAVVDKVVKRLADLMKEDTFTGKDDIEFQAIYKRRIRLEEAMTNCVYGIDKDKIAVKELITSVLQEIFPTQEDLYKIYPLNGYAVEPHWQFEILMERLYPTYKKNSLSYLISKYGWDSVRYNIEDGTVPSYNVSTDDLQEAFDNEILEPLTFRESLAVVTTLIYEEYKGMGCIDTLRTMNIDGFNIGTSGSIMSSNLNDAALDFRAPRSVWVYYQGKYIHFQFLNFGDENEVKRVVQLLARYNNPGPLTEKRGYLVNTMYDKSRVLAIRPNAGEYWACFVRKFVLSSHTLEALIDPVRKDPSTGDPLYTSVPMTEDELYLGQEDWDNMRIKVDMEAHCKLLPQHKYNNAVLPQEMIKLLMRGQVTTGFTGRQGSGKTTMMVAAISQVDARFNIRVLEMAPEMYLREIYTQRNILSVAETPTVDAAQLQDALKKSDAALSIVGEVATDVIAARMIQMGQVASIFTIFSHHANRTVDLVHALTNSIVSASGGSATPATVEPQVIDVIKVDCHLDYDVLGNRYIERITEIIRLDSQPYPEQDKVHGETLEEYKVRLDKEYYTRQTDRQSFTTRDVLVFNPHTFTYDVARDKNGIPVFFSPELTRHIFSRLPVDEVQQWKEWVNKYWFSA